MTNKADACVSPWRTSTYSGGGNQCIEVAVLPDGHVAVRDTKNREAGMHLFSAAAWRAFLTTIKDER